MLGPRAELPTSCAPVIARRRREKKKSGIKVKRTTFLDRYNTNGTLLERFHCFLRLRSFHAQTDVFVGREVATLPSHEANRKIFGALIEWEITKRFYCLCV